MSSDTSGRVLALGCNPDCGIRDFSQGSGAMTRVIVGFLLCFEFLVRLAEITQSPIGV